MSFLIRKSSDQSLRATPRSLSQLITSFIGSWCQGIPLALFFAWPLIVLPISVNHIRKVHILVLYYSWIMQAHYWISVFLAKIVFLPLQMIFKMSICKTFSLLLPSHNCIIIHNVQFSRCIWVLISKRLNETSLLRCFSQSLWSGGPKWTRFPAGKPRRLKQSTGLFLRAGFRVLEGFSSSNSYGTSIMVSEIGGPKWTRTIDLTIISRVL